MADKKFIGFNPFSFQKAVLKEICFPEAKGKGKTVVCKSQRQRGKSFMCANILLYYSINFQKTKNYFVSPTLKQAKEIYKLITNAIQESGIVKSSNATDLIIRLKNGSSISFKSAEQKENLRGFTCNGILIVDEAAFITDDVFNIILPWVDFHKANLLLCSTPFVKTGFFFRYWNYGLNHEFNTVSVDWTSPEFQPDMLKIMSEERLEMYRKTLPKNVFLTDYLGEWLDDDGCVFTQFKKCVMVNQIKPSDRLWVGIDWAAGVEADDTAISIINQDGKQVYLAYWNNLTPTQQIDKIDSILSQYLKQIVVVQTELNGLGSPLTDFLKERSHLKTIKDKFIGFTTTNASKNALVQNLQLAFEQDRIKILGDEKQINELGYYSAEFNPKTRNVTYNAPSGLHDDLCLALMFSYDAFINGQIIGNYNISVI